jgi:signal transduction histidine kinase/CheY-like chemotaxis protein
LEPASGDEIAEVTVSFASMRSTLQKTQDDQKLLEERLRQAHKMEAVGRLAGGVAHDFNNLLTIIRGHSDLLLDRQGADDAYRRSLEQIQRASDRAVSMTRQLLAFSRMQVLQPRVLDLNAIVADMGKMLSRLIGEHIEYVFLPDTKLSAVKADPGQVEQVIMNLAVNARDAMPDGGKVTVHTCNVVFNDAQAALRPPMTPGNYAMLTVSDTGHGMDEKVKARIFDPFFTTKEVGKGTGLGLATVYGVVKQSGGFVWVESEPGKGATFEIYLPQALEKVDAPETQMKPSALPRGSETILLVEDEEGVRELARRFLTGSGYSVLEAGDGVQALEVAARYDGTIHLLLSDMVMPRMGGPALVKQLRATRPDVKVLLMSGYAEYAGGKNLGPDETVALQKPFSLISLVKKVREVLEGRSASEKDSGVSESIAI